MVDLTSVEALKNHLQSLDFNSMIAYAMDYYIKKAPLKHPYWVLYSLIAIIVFIILIKTDFIKFPNREEKISYKKQMKWIRRFVILTRTIIIILLFIALASPYTYKERQVEGEPSIMILEDHSESFSIFQKDIAKNLKLALEKRIPVKSMEIASGLRSAIGDGVLSSLKGDDSLIIVSDGNNNYGRDLGDVVMLASKMNTTINALELEPEKGDTSIIIEGSSSAIVGGEISLQAIAGQTGQNVPYHISVEIDSISVLDQDTSGKQMFDLTKKLSQGPHKIIGKVTIDSGLDYFAQNNEFYKTVNVLPKPTLLFVSETASPLAEKLKELYNVEATDFITPGAGEAGLEKYSTLIINNMAADKFSSDQTATLTDYLIEGGGLFVIGGENSFDYGGYKNSIFETLLPVQSGKGEKKPEEKANIVIVIDISGSTGASFGSDSQDKKVDVEKAMAVSILDDITDKDRVGVVAFNSFAFMISPVTPLKDKKEELVAMISSLKDGGGTSVLEGVKEAERMLINMQGSNNIIIISDGVTTNTAGALERIAGAQAGAIKTYAVGVGGDTNEEFMKNAAMAGKGIYFKPDQSQNLKIIFGDPEDKKGMTLTSLNSNHFITKDISLSGDVTGFNQVVPKSSASALVTTSAGDSLLTVWRFGLGRVAVWSTDNGQKWAGPMLSQENSKLITKTINWVIGDPSKTRGFGLFTEDTRLGEDAEIILKSDKTPRGELKFEKIDDDTFKAIYTPTEAGFYEVLGNYIATSYPKEYEKTGMNEELKNLVSSTGGQMFSKDDIDGIVQKAISTSKRTEMQETSLRWPFFMAAILIFLLEIIVRKIRENM